MQYPNRPAVALVHAMVPDPRFELEVWSVERELWEFSAYYRLPAFSVKAAFHHLVFGGAPGYVRLVFCVDRLQ
jgi:hypothetical protein